MQIGQIMLTMPNAMAKMGLIAAIPLAVVIACMSLWSMKMLICLYVARRSILVSTDPLLRCLGDSSNFRNWHCAP